MTETEIRGLGALSGACSEHHAHLSNSHVESASYRSRSRSPALADLGMMIPPLNLVNNGRGAGGVRSGRESRSPSYQQGSMQGSLPNSPRRPETPPRGMGVGMVERWERDRGRAERETELRYIFLSCLISKIQ